MTEILFVCTGNIFRSMIAENALRVKAGSDTSYCFASAGTEAKKQDMVDLVFDGLLERGIDPSGQPNRPPGQRMCDFDQFILGPGLRVRADIQWWRVGDFARRDAKATDCPGGFRIRGQDGFETV